MSLVEKNYEILSNDSTECLAADLTERLRNGWELHGSLITYSTEQGQIFMQAVIYVPQWR
jgi:hypothetical protein